MSKRQKIGLIFACLLCLSLVIQFSPAAADSPREILRLGRGTANTLDWRPDKQIGARAVLGGVQLYDADYHETTLLDVPELNAGQSLSLDWSPNGHFLAADVGVFPPNQEPSYTTYVWEISADGKIAQQKFTVSEGGYISHVSWKPDSTQVAVGGRVFDVEKGKLMWMHHYGRIQFDIQTGKSTRSERNLTENTNISWSPDGKQFVSMDYDVYQGESATYAIFADTSDELVIALKDSEVYSRSDFVWSPDGSKIADSYGRNWDAHTGVIASSDMSQNDNFNSPFASSPVNQILWSADNQSFVVLSTGIPLPGAPSSVLYKVDALTGIKIYRKLFWHTIKLGIWMGEVVEAYSDSGDHLFINAATGDVFSAERTSGFPQINDLAWSPDSTQLVAIAPGPANYPLQLWDVEKSRTSDEPMLVWTVNDDWFDFEKEANQYMPDYAKVLWSADGKEIITISNDYSAFRTFHSVERWDAEDGASLGRIYFSSDNRRPPTAEPSPDLSLLAQTNTYWYMQDSDKPHAVEILRGDNLQLQMTFDSANADAVTWSPDNRLLATVGIAKAKTEIWDVSQKSAQLLTTIEADSEDRGGVWSTDGSLIAIGTQIHDPKTGKLISQIPFESQYRYWVEWNPNNRIIALFGYGYSHINFYNTYTGALIESEAAEGVTALAWSPDGTMLALGMDDGAIRIWDVSDLE